jgi:hypothetical protein
MVARSGLGVFAWEGTTVYLPITSAQSFLLFFSLIAWTIFFTAAAAAAAAASFPACSLGFLSLYPQKSS